MIGRRIKGSRRSAGPLRRLLVTDIDGTLVDASGRLSPGTTDAMRRLRDSGWDIAVATGRILATAVPYMDALGSSLPAVVYDGGRVMARSGEVLWQRAMDGPLLLEILEAAWDSGLEIQVMSDEKVLCRPQDKCTLSFFERAGVPYRAGLLAPSLPGGDFYRVMFYDPSENLAGDFSREIREAFGDRAEVVLAGNGFVDVLPSGVNKGYALSRMLELSSVNYHTVVAFGDNENDLELLRAADLPVAVSSAPDDLLAMAVWIVPPPRDRGPEVLVEKLMEVDCLMTDKEVGFYG